LLQALEVIPAMRTTLATKCRLPLLHIIGNNIEDFSRLFQLLHASLNDDLSCDSIIKHGFDQRLDELCDLALHSDQKILEL
jgi:DNA mismatch repair ATPase MutS